MGLGAGPREIWPPEQSPPHPVPSSIKELQAGLVGEQRPHPMGFPGICMLLGVFGGMRVLSASYRAVSRRDLISTLLSLWRGMKPSHVASLGWPRTQDVLRAP